MKVYGPYTRKDGRSHVILYENGKRTTKSYPRYLMEEHLGRSLEDWEQVDHINNDPSDNRIENLQILSQRDNLKKSARQPEILQFKCSICGTTFEREASRYRWSQGKRKSLGPYCSKSCAATTPP